MKQRDADGASSLISCIDRPRLVTHHGMVHLKDFLCTFFREYQVELRRYAIGIVYISYYIIVDSFIYKKMHRYGHNTHHPSKVVDLYSTHTQIAHIHLRIHVYRWYLSFSPPKTNLGHWKDVHWKMVMYTPSALGCNPSTGGLVAEISKRFSFRNMDIGGW